MRTSTLIGFVAAHALELSLLKHAEQLDLRRSGYLADLVEEERAAVRLLEAADARRRSAPVNEPFSCPKSSLSSRVSASAAQCTATNGLSARGLSAWMARASSPLPVPLSPVMSTVALAGGDLPGQAIDLLHRGAGAD